MKDFERYCLQRGIEIKYHTNTENNYLDNYILSHLKIREELINRQEQEGIKQTIEEIIKHEIEDTFK